MPLPSAGRDVYACVDEVDAVVLSQRWHVNGQGYATCVSARVKGEPRASEIRLHRVIAKRMGIDLSNQVDHINGHELDCRRSNLRSATKSENMRNRGAPANNTSGFKGVIFHKQSGLWWARIAVDGKDKSLRMHATAEDAARAYDAAARELHGAFAYLNFPVD